MITVYGKHGCGYCVKAKNLLESKKIPFTYLTLGEDVGINEFVAQYPEIRSVPFIINNNGILGGFNELQAYLEDIAGTAENF
jgi:glutaredoxin 1